MYNIDLDLFVTVMVQPFVQANINTRYYDLLIFNEVHTNSQPSVPRYVSVMPQTTFEVKNVGLHMF